MTDQLQVIIVGSGGYGREVLGYLGDLRRAGATFTVRGFIDDRPESEQGYAGVPWLGPIAAYSPDPLDRFVIAIGEPVARARVVSALDARNASYLNIVHPTAHVGANAILGTGCIIGPLCVVANEGYVDDHAMLTLYAAVGHDAYVGRFATLSPHTVVNGDAEIGDGVFLGSHASVNPGITIGAWSKIAAGSVVYDCAPAGSLVTGNPATAIPLGHEDGGLIHTPAS